MGNLNPANRNRGLLWGLAKKFVSLNPNHSAKPVTLS